MRINRCLSHIGQENLERATCGVPPSSHSIWLIAWGCVSTAITDCLLRHPGNSTIKKKIMVTVSIFLKEKIPW